MGQATIYAPRQGASMLEPLAMHFFEEIIKDLMGESVFMA